MGGENVLPKFFEGEVNRDDAFNLASVRPYRHAERAYGIMIVDDAGVEVAEGIDPAGLAALHGFLIPVLFEVLEFRLELGAYGVAFVDCKD